MTWWKRWSRRLAIAILVLPLLAIVVLLVTRQYLRWTGDSHLAKVEAELDARDPNWRLEAILAQREAAKPPDAENPMMLIQNQFPRIPASYDEWSKRPEGWTDELPPNRLPDPDDAKEAKAIHEEALPVIKELRKLRSMDRLGWFPIKLKDSVNDINLGHTQHARQAAGLLKFDVEVSALAGNPDQALTSTHAILHMSRAIGDEPTLIAMLVRYAMASVAVNAAERTLGYGEAKTGLAEFQAALHREANEPVLAMGMRGERAYGRRMLDDLEHNRLNLMQTAGAAPQSKMNPIERIFQWFSSCWIPGESARYLELMNRCEELAKEPYPQRLTLFQQFEDEMKQQWATDRVYLRNIIVSLLMPAIVKVVEADARTHTRLQCAAVGIACERFRQAQGRWPTTLAEIPQQILAELPNDPHTGGPLKYLRVDDGVIIYSTGKDGQDDGGNLSQRNEPGTDLGFRLWDVPSRRAAPLRRVMKDEDDRE